MTELYSLFPTPVIRVPATEDNYDPVQLEIKAAIDIIKKTNDSSSLTYFYKGAPETEISNKTYDFIEKFNCVNLEKRIYDAVNDYVDRIGWLSPRKFSIRGSWINILQQDVNHTHHCHPGYLISGTYYYRVSEKQGSISFNNPNSIMMYCQFPQGQLCPQTVDIIPDDGDIVLFPSWLIHSTRKNKSLEERISIAFNIDYIGGTDISLGLIKESHIPHNRTEYSLRSIIERKI
jgi:uncharacterized protein (TIGR02466 family)